MSSENSHIYEFGPFRLDAEARVLTRDGEPVPLTPKAVETLLVLVERNGRVVSREELMREVWPDTFVEDNNLSVNVSALRRALGSTPEGKPYIETLARRGYRFAHKVERLPEGVFNLTVEREMRERVIVIEEEFSDEDSRSEAVVTYATTADAASLAPARGRSWSRLVVAGVVLAVVVAGVLSYRALTRGDGQPRTSSEVKSLAVLPFKSMSADAGDEYLGLGLADSLITQLSDARPIIVRPTSAVRKYAQADATDPLAAGRELRVEAVLEGSVQRDGERLRVTARLLRVSDGASLWTGTFDARSPDIFAVQDSISSQVARSLRLGAGGLSQSRKHYTENVDAYHDYLRGRYFWSKWTEEGLKRSVEYFKRTIESDPAYALAYAGLADSYNMLGDWGYLRIEEAYPKARDAAEKALAIDDEMAEPHAALAFALMMYYWDWAGAEREYRRAIELNPNYVTARSRYGVFLAWTGRTDEAKAELARAHELEPFAVYLVGMQGIPYYYARQYDEAARRHRVAVEMDSSFPYAHYWLGRALVQKGDYDEAIAEFRLASELSGGTGLMLGQLGHAYAVAGRRGEALKTIEELKEMSERRHVSPFVVATIYAGLGDEDAAFEWLEKAYERRDDWMITLATEPHFDRLRPDPRFQDLLRRVGLKRD